MSLDYGSLIQSGTSLVRSSAPLRAQVQWARILDKPTEIVLIRQEVAQPAQTVRIELENTITMETGSGGTAASRQATLFGIQDHPTLPDTDVQEWDVFVLDNQEYTVTSVNRQTHGQIQAYCEGV